MAVTSDVEWISYAHEVLTSVGNSLHVAEIEEMIRNNLLKSTPVSGPSMSLEVLLTKEAAMGRRFTKPEGSLPGFFNLLPPQLPVTSSEGQSSISPKASSSHTVTSPQTETVTANQKYQHKYRHLKKMCKKIIYLNSALYDEIARLEKKIEKSTVERRSLLTKIMVDQNIINPKDVKVITKPTKDGTAGGSSSTSKQASQKEGEVSKKRKEIGPGDTPTSKKSKSSEYSLTEASLGNIEKSSKKSKNGETGKKQPAVKIPPISLDSSGRPVFPIPLPAGLTIYSIGEITEKAGYCTTSCIYPVGYCVTREYASLSNPAETCTYTCKISEGISGPKFEISPDEEQDVDFTDKSPDVCHGKLVSRICELADCKLEISEMSDFFGLKHPVVRNLLQCSQGASGCKQYSFSKFEVVRDNSAIDEVAADLDPTNSIEALKKILKIDCEEDGKYSDDGKSDVEEQG